jgi:hypothetical protein
LTTATGRARLRQQQLLVRAPAAARPPTARRFTVWNGSSISPAHRTIEDLAIATYALLPAGVWDEVELLLKAGEGGTWQSAFDPHPLALSGPTMLAAHIATADGYALRITPYVVVRGRGDWLAGEQAQIRQCVQVARRCILNVEPGAPYWNGPNDPGFIRGYLRGIGVQASALEVCLIPRQTQVDELGGAACIRAWTDPALVGAASWETYGMAAPGYGRDSLQVDAAIPRLDGWGVPPAPQYRIPLVQRDERDRWTDTPWCAAGLAVWHLDGNI